MYHIMKGISTEICWFILILICHLGSNHLYFFFFMADQHQDFLVGIALLHSLNGARKCSILRNLLSKCKTPHQIMLLYIPLVKNLLFVFRPYQPLHQDLHRPYIEGQGIYPMGPCSSMVKPLWLLGGQNQNLSSLYEGLLFVVLQ